MTRHLVLSIAPLLLWGTAFAQQANVNLDYDPQKNTENLVPFSAPLNSPDVRDDRTVVLRLKAPEAHRVSLAGVAILTGLGRSKPVPFVKGDDGLWSLTIGPMKPDMYAFSERRRRRWPIDYRSASRRSRAGAIAAVQIS